MQKIEIDDEVFGYLKRQAKPFEEPSPNHVLRRLLGLKRSAEERISESQSALSGGRRAAFGLDDAIARMIEQVRDVETPRGKAPKTDLTTLVRQGVLSDGQTVYFRDYRDQIHREISAKIDGAGLRIGGARLAMSAAARQVFNKMGYATRSVRGPAHWCTEAGVTVQQIWERYLAQREKEA